MSLRQLAKKYKTQLVTAAIVLSPAACFAADSVIPEEAQTYLTNMMLIIAAVGTAGLAAVIAAGSYKLVRKAF